MKSDTLIRVHRDEKDIGFFTREIALESIRAGILRSDDWAFCEGLSDWVFLGDLLANWADFQFVSVTPPPLPILASPPPLPQPSRILPKTSGRPNQNAKRTNPIALACVVGLGAFVTVAFWVTEASKPTLSTDTPTYTLSVDQELRGRIVDYDKMRPMNDAEKEMTRIILNGPLFQGRKVTEREFVDTLDKVLKERR